MDLTKILIEGETYWSPLLGDCVVEFDAECATHPIVIANDSGSISLTRNGHYKCIERGDCLIFPSKENRSWDDYIPRGSLVIANDINAHPRYICFYIRKHGDKHLVSYGLGMAGYSSFPCVELYDPSKHII